MDSILKTVKTALNVSETDEAFDEELVLWINSTFWTLKQLGIGPVQGFVIEGDGEDWDEFLSDEVLLSQVKSYITMKAKLQFDPPSTGFHTTSLTELIKEAEWRLSVDREDVAWVPPLVPVVVDAEEF